MKRLFFSVLLCLLAVSPIFADTEDNAVFRTRMLPDNEVPPIPAIGNSATAAITIHATRDGRGNISGATVTFEIDYTLTASTTFNGLHIHNAPTAVNGAVVIDSGISGASPVAAAPGSGRISRTVNYTAADTAGLSFVTGLLSTPENYYVNIHTTTNAGGFMRGQLLPNHLALRPIMSPAFEVPAINIDAEGSALVDIQVNRDANGTITSGTVAFDVNYRFPVAAVTFTGLHLHNGPEGVNAPVVIDSGLNGTTRAITSPGGIGNIFRIAEIDSSNTAGLAALTGLMNDPTQFYINLHTTVNPGGVIRGQLSRNLYVFFNQMTGAEETPVTNTGGYANSMTYVRADRDSTGNIVSGAVSFNLNFNMNGGPVTFTGFHIHNGKFSVAAPVVISTGIAGGANSVTSDTGNGSIRREVAIDTSNPTALDSLRGLIQNPELYYVNLHTTVFPGGVIRAQLAQETYHFKANMTTANEVPPVPANTSATGWITAKVNRDANGVVNGGTVTFDVNYVNDGPITFTGLHIHYPGTASVNASVVINTGIGGGATSVDSTTGSGNITRVVTIDPTNVTQLAALSTLITAPDNAYVNIHTTQFGGGVARSQMGQVVNTVAQAVGGGSWITSITIRNPSATTAVQGAANFFQSNGTAMPEAISDPNIGFLIPPAASVTISTHNAGTLTGGFARVFSNGAVTVDARYNHPAFVSSTSGATTVSSRSVSLPVAVGTPATQNTGVALIAGAAGTLTLSLRDGAGNAIAGGSRTVDVTAGQQLTAFVRELLPGVTQSQFSGTLTITTSAGTISVLGMQFDGTMTPVVVTALP